LSYAVRLYATGDNRLAMPTFGFSIVYLFGLFAALMLDHYAIRCWKICNSILFIISHENHCKAERASYPA
jgi:hypothetical protein